MKQIGPDTPPDMVADVEGSARLSESRGGLSWKTTKTASRLPIGIERERHETLDLV